MLRSILRWTTSAVAATTVALALVAPASGSPPPRSATRVAATVSVEDAYVDKARYLPGQSVTVSSVIKATGGAWSGPVTFAVTHLGNPVASGSVSASVGSGATTTVNWTTTPPAQDFRGYLVRVTAGSSSTSTAIDVSSDWTVFPRMGFLTDYRASLTQGEADAEVQNLVRKYHLNALQFYDWMWRHDKPIKRNPDGSLASTWTAWNGDVIAPASVSKYIGAAHDRSVAALPYSMSYAALKDYEQVSGVSSDWRLKRADGSPWEFEMIPGESLYMFDPGNQNWQNHITDEYKDQVQTLGFDGTHIDQLGDWGPMTNVSGQPVDLPAGFGSLVTSTKSALSTTPGQVVGMNAVDGYGSDALASSGAVDYLYTEVWGQHEKYIDVKALLDRQQKLSGGESRVVAAYVNNYDNHGPRYEAENAVLSSGLAVNNNHTGYTGTGFVDQFGTQGQKITFTVSAPEARRYSLNFRYANATGAAVTRTVRVDGTVVGRVTLQPKANWDSWGLPSSITAQLSAGNHTVELEIGAQDSGYANVDSLVLGTFDSPSVKLANAAFAAMGSTHLELGQGGNMLSNPYFPDFSKQMPNELSAWMKGYYDFITAYENLLYGPDVYSVDSGSQIVKLTGVAASGAANANTVWTNVKRTANHDVIHLVNLLGNNDEWRSPGKAVPPGKSNVPVKYYIGPDLTPSAVRVASPDRDAGASTSLPFSIGTDAAGRYIEFTVPELQTWDMVYLDRSFTTPADHRYEAESAIKTNVTVGSNHAGYTGTGFVDNFATTDSGVTFTVSAASDATVNLTIRYANALASTTRAVSVDGEVVATPTFASTGSWDSWSTVTVAVPLRHGLHSVVLWQQSGQSGAVNIDHLST